MALTQVTSDMLATAAPAANIGSGEVLEPIWLDVEDLATIERFGFTKDELLAL